MSSMNDYENETRNIIFRFLEHTLPQIAFGDWWGDLVLNGLSETQRRIVAEYRIDKLDGLDLDALLKVFHFNWPQLKSWASLPTEVKNSLFVMKEIRNRLAHNPVCGLTVEDRYFWLYHIARFVQFLEPTNTILLNVRRDLLSLMGELSNSASVASSSAPCDVASGIDAVPINGEAPISSATNRAPLEELKLDAPSSSDDSMTDIARVMFDPDAIESATPYHVELLGDKEFRRVYYESVLLDANSLRGAHPSATVRTLCGNGIGIVNQTDGVYLRPLAGSPECRLDDTLLEPGTLMPCPVGRHGLRIADLEFQININKTSYDE